jgi:chromosome segregation ATPase
VDSLTEQLAQKDAELTKTSEQLNALTEKYSHLKQQSTALLESKKTSRTEISTLNESLVEIKKAAEAEKITLTEQVNELKQDAVIKKKEYASKLSTANKLVEQYRDVAKKAVTRYIDSKARALGISSNEIRNRLSESYSFEDIDAVCEELQQYRVNMNNLPFNLGATNSGKVKVTESKEPIKPLSRFDDDVDDSLLKMVNNLN